MPPPTFSWHRYSQKTVQLRILLLIFLMYPEHQPAFTVDVPSNWTADATPARLILKKNGSSAYRPNPAERRGD